MELLKVLLVDDDMLSIAFMKDSFDWNSYGYEIVGVAYNGKQALKQFQLLSPDLIISDVSMPLMNGVDLAKSVKAENGNAHIVLLTAYSEFEYVREAIKADVDDYLIKDELTEALLHNCLDKIRERIARDNRIDHIVFQHAMRDYFNEGEGYVMAHYSAPGIADFIRERHIFWILAENAPLLTTGNRKNVMKDASFDEAIEAFFQTHGLGKCSVRSFIIMGNRVVAWSATAPAMHMTPDAGGMHQVAREFLNEIRAAGGRFSLLYTQRPANINILGALMHAGSPAHCAQLIFGEDSVCPISQMPVINENINLEVTADITSRLAECDDAVAIERELFPLLFSADERCAPYERCRYFLKSIFNQLSRQVVFDYHAIIDICDLRHCAGLFAELIMAQRSQSDYRAEVRKTIEYLKRNYGNPKLRISLIARHVGLSDSRLSVIFKEDTGLTVMQYLTNLRIGQAKRLLKKGDLRIYEIAEQVGYDNSQYFSTIFYKETGMYPSQYKEE